MMTGSYWPWWLGAIALATVTVGFALIHGRPLGVSGIYARLLNWRAERAADLLSENQDRLRDALLEATRRRFGDAMPQIDQETGTEPVTRTGMPVREGLLFVTSLVMGGFLAEVLTGRLGPGPSLLGGSVTTLALLAVGGLFIGFGTRMAGGCTSGHGLSGCSRLETASLLATASFFGAAVAVSLLLSWWQP